MTVADFYLSNYDEIIGYISNEQNEFDIED